ncbi:protein arginine N-methyltransferase 5-like [Haemaphysalis longicornis]
MADSKTVSCGVDLHYAKDLSEAIISASQAGYKFVACPINHPRARPNFDASGDSRQFVRPDLVLPSQDWSTLVTAKISEWIDVDSPVDSFRKMSEKFLQQELSYAAHLGVPAILMKVESCRCINLARILTDSLAAVGNHQFFYQAWVMVPMESSIAQTRSYLCLPSAEGEQRAQDNDGNNAGDAERCSNYGDHEDSVGDDDPWEWWSAFRSVCGPEKRLGLVLRLTEQLPSERRLARWLGEPVKCIVVSTALFVNNKKGFPVLTRPHQLVVQRFFKLNCQVMIEGCCRHDHMRLYYQYIEHLYNTMPEDDVLGQFAKGYEDFLQMPLQPLMDNLETATYEIFEKDPVKYTEYQSAIHQALVDKGAQVGKDTEIVVMVVGAGRGPLVTATLNASERAQQKVRVYAVEKNPNAVVTLLTLKEETWKERVTVVSCDMRDFEAPEKADILVSELLGSFGDNEVSPECLDGAQRFLKDDGISIPCQYTSYLAPIQSHKLYSEVSALRDKDKHPLTPFEVPYVVRLHNVTVLAEQQPLFTFVHPNKETPFDNNRYKVLKFEIPDNYHLHGFAGYFDTILYKDIKLSICPNTHSPGMFSWFPMLFPLKAPVRLHKGCTLEIHFWRCVGRSKVWYEWLVASPEVGTVHNPCGRSYTIGL